MKTCVEPLLRLRGITKIYPTVRANDDIEGKTCVVSGSGNVALHAAERVHHMGGKVITLSDSTGFIYDRDGIDQDKLGTGRASSFNTLSCDARTSLWVTIPSK